MILPDSNSVSIMVENFDEKKKQKKQKKHSELKNVKKLIK